MIFAIGPYAIPLGALAVSISALVYGVVGSRQKAEGDLVSHLYERIRDLERQAQLCAERCQDLEKKVLDLTNENFRLMRRLLKLENGNGDEK